MSGLEKPVKCWEIATKGSVVSKWDYVVYRLRLEEDWIKVFNRDLCDPQNNPEGLVMAYPRNEVLYIRLVNAST